MPNARRLPPGKVRDAILTFLRATTGEVSVSDIHAAVSTTLGTNVAASSIRSSLRLHTPQLFQRTRRGYYRLRGRK